MCSVCTSGVAPDVDGVRAGRTRYCFKSGATGAIEGDCVCEPEVERERHKQSYEIAGGRIGSKLLLFGTNAVSACKFQVL